MDRSPASQKGGRRKKKRIKTPERIRRRAFVFLALAGILVVISLIAPLICPNDPYATSAADMNRAPCAQYPFGTDRYGRCVCSRVLMGARTSIFSAVALVGLTFLFGSVLGLLAARLSGCSGWTIMIKSLLPNMLGPLLVTAATQIGVMMIGIAGLSFLGIGVIEPQAEWGSMINTSRAYLQLAPWAVLAPAVATIITVMVFNYLGDCVRDALEAKEAET